MIPIEVIKRIRAIEIKTRKIVNTTFTGEYHSVFKGQGISFSEVREYQPGDDVRLIDWNVTAKTGSPHIKVFEEERELTVMLCIDLSASGDFGTVDKTRVEMAAEVAAVLGFSALNNKDKVGLILFTDQIEHYIPPKKGKDHMFRILREIFYHQANSKRTSIKVGLDYLNKICKKKAIVFLISDFIDEGYEQNLRISARKHDLVPIMITDPKERELPDTGIMAFEDEETGEVLHLNTSSKDIRERFTNVVLARHLEKERLFKSLKLTPVKIELDQSYVKPLDNYFKSRAGRR